MNNIQDERKNLDRELADFDDDEFIPDSEKEILSRARDIEDGLKNNTEETILKILADSIARDEYAARRGKRGPNIANLSQALTLASRIKGIADAHEKNIVFNIMDCISQPEKALENIIIKRATGELSSKQANDLALLLEKLTDQTKVKELHTIVMELKEQNIGSESEIKVIKQPESTTDKVTH